MTWNSKITGINTSDPAQFIVPYVLDPSNPSHLVLGTNRVYQSTNRADSWTVISPVLSATSGATIAALAIAPSSSSTILAVYSDGTVWLTTNGGSTWSERDSGLPSSSYGSSSVDVVFDPSNAQTAYLVRGRFGSGQVWRTTNGGTSWTNISGDLPDVPAHTIVLDTRPPRRSSTSAPTPASTGRPTWGRTGRGSGRVCRTSQSTTWRSVWREIPDHRHSWTRCLAGRSPRRWHPSPARNQRPGQRRGLGRS